MKTIVVRSSASGLFLFWDSDLCAQASWDEVSGESR